MVTLDYLITYMDNRIYELIRNKELMREGSIDLPNLEHSLLRLRGFLMALNGTN